MKKSFQTTVCSQGDEDAADRLRQEAQRKGKDLVRLIARRSVKN